MTLLTLSSIRAIIGIDAVLLFASVLYFALATDYPNVTYISDLDYGRLDYRIGMTALVMLQITSNAIYAFARKRRHWIEFACVTVAMVFAIAGWCVVSFAHAPGERYVRNNCTMHLTGARLYVSGCLATALFMCHDAWALFRKTHARSHEMLFAAIAASVVLACLFGLLFSRRDSHDWIYEHLLFLAYILCHLLFFINMARACRENEDEVS